MLKLDPKTTEIAEKNNFEVQGYSFDAQTEELRKPRIVRVAAIQHSIVKPTTDKISVQRDAIIEKVTKIVEAAAASGVNVLCFQEAWSKSKSATFFMKFRSNFRFLLFEHLLMKEMYST